jgi:replicative DNA helicase
MYNSKYVVENIPDIVFPMWQAAGNAVDMARELASPTLTKLTTGLPEVDKYLNPFLSGYLISMIARPGHGKTFFSDYMLMRAMSQISTSGREESEAVVLISTEVPVEVAALKWMARFSGISVQRVIRGECTLGEIEQIEEASYKLMGYPIFFIGHSEQRGKNGKKSRPNLAPETIDKGLDYIINTFKNSQGDFLEIKLLVTDYLQQLKRPMNTQETSFYSYCVDWAKDVAVWSGAPHLLNVQAGRQVDERPVQIPLIGDPQWTSNVEQTSTVVLSGFRPDQAKVKTMPPIWNQTPELAVTPALFYLTLLKQKEAISNKVWPLHMDFNNYGLSSYKLPVDRH